MNGIDPDPDVEVFEKCVDDQNSGLDYKLIRGYGGVCVFWRKSLYSSVKISSQGNGRTIIVEIATYNKPICLVNVYMPQLKTIRTKNTKRSWSRLKRFLKSLKTLIKWFYVEVWMPQCNELRWETSCYRTLSRKHNW